MDIRDNELDKLEKLAESFQTMGNFTQVMRDSVSQLESHYEDLNSRLARVNELLQQSLDERNRLANYLNNILESLDSGVIVTDKNGIIDVFNSAAERYTGIAASHAMGRRYSEFAGGNGLFSLTNLGEKSVASGEITMTPPAGASMPLAYSITRLRQDENARSSGYVIILYNMTEIKQLEENLKRVSTLAALGEMAAVVAHEIRNPLAGIRGFIELVLRDLPADNASRRLVERAFDGVKSLDRIVAMLLDYTRAVTPNLDSVEPVTVVEGAINDLKAGFETESCTFHIETADRKLKAKLDPQLFRMAVFNIIKNAVQARPDGKVKVTMKSSAGGDLHIIIDDNGPGLPQAAIEKLFTPFYTTRADGIGLGLAIVKKLIELHGGLVTAENRSDGGARFMIQLPNAVVGENNEV